MDVKTLSWAIDLVNQKRDALNPDLTPDMSVAERMAALRALNGVAGELLDAFLKEFNNDPEDH